jgi:hypothetical protein
MDGCGRESDARRHPHISKYQGNSPADGGSQFFHIQRQTKNVELGKRKVEFHSRRLMKSIIPLV